MRPVRCLVAACAVVLVGCSGSESSKLSGRYPAAAERILTGPGFVAADGAYVRSEGVDPALVADPVKAAEASLARRNGLQLRLPAAGADAARLTLPGGATVEVRERGLTGPARTERGALAYSRADGTSWWTVTGDGFEEWVEVANAGAGPVAEWDVSGASLRQAGDAVELLDAAGAARIRVTAPRAYERGGAVKRAWLRAEGGRLALYTDARGVAIVDPAWTTAASTADYHGLHTATLLFTGKVLVVGGSLGPGGSLAGAELYDPATGAWSRTGSLAQARYSHTATMLPSGRVLVVGGYGGGFLGSAEIYDPVAGTWGSASPLAEGRQLHTATLLPSGKVLVAGGHGAAGYMSSAEIYDPSTGTWNATAPMSNARANHAATLLSSGKVLVSGGTQDGSTFISAAELFDPAENGGSGGWIGTGAMVAAREYHTATLLPSGKVLAVGGGWLSTFVSSAEVFDPAGNGGVGSWSGTAALSTGRYRHSASLLPSGMVLIVGGQGATGYLASTELFDPSGNGGAGSWSSAGALLESRECHTATLLPSGRVLVTGGSPGRVSSELFDPAVPVWVSSGNLVTARYGQTATLLATGEVLIAGGTSGPYESGAEIYTPAGGGTWAAVNSMSTARTGHTATLLVDGRVLVAGGYGAGLEASAELFDPGSRTWASAMPMNEGRYAHVAVALPSGKVLIAGGYAAGSQTASAELFDPSTGAWTAIASMNAARSNAAGLVLPDGKVIVLGGMGPSGTLTNNNVEVFDPATGIWTGGSIVSCVAYGQSATLLPSGRILVAGGNSAGTLAAAALLDPDTRICSATGSMATARGGHRAALLPGGKVLVVGGSGDAGTGLASTEIYDPGAGTWSSGGTLATAITAMSVTPMPDGKVLVAGGYGGVGPTYIGSTLLFDEGRGALDAARPTIDVANRAVIAGRTLQITGSGFRGLTEGSGGGTQSSPTDYPLVQLRSGDGGGTVWAQVSDFDATRAVFLTPTAFPPGPSWVSLVVNGVPSIAASFTVLPPIVFTPAAPSILPKESITLAAAGGSGTGYLWSVVTPNSGGDFTSGSTYRAGSAGNVIDTVRVEDSLGNVATLDIAVGAGVSVTPTSRIVVFGETVQLTASGGDGTYAWEVVPNPSAATIGATGTSVTYTAGAMTGVDTVVVSDTLGNTANATLDVRQPVSITNATLTVAPRDTLQLAAIGGAGAPYAWSLTGATPPGGGIDPATGLFSAGTSASTTYGVRVEDALGHAATATVQVTAGASITPASVIAVVGESLTFDATGGTGSGFAWSVLPNNSGATFTPAGASVTYTAGSAPNVVDTVRVQDSVGNVATATVDVRPVVSVVASSFSVAPRGTLQLFATGGSGTGYTWSLTGATPPGGGIIPATGLFSAGTSPSTSYGVRVTDSVGHFADATVTVTAGITVTPPSAIAVVGETINFAATGGSGAGFGWTLAPGGSGGTLGATGATVGYTAGATADSTDTINVADGNGNTASVQVQVKPAVAITNATLTVPPRGELDLSATGGSGTGWVWTLVGATPPGGGIDPSSGLFAAGTAPSTGYQVRVTDSVGHAATVTVQVTAGVSITPSATTLTGGATWTFTPAGGSGAGWIWALSDDRSGGSITAAGVYTAGGTPNVVDVITLTDSLGNSATAQVTVLPAPASDDPAKEGTKSAYGCSSAGSPGASLLLFGLVALALGRTRRRGAALLLALAVAAPLAARAAKDTRSRVAVMPVRAGMGIEPKLAELVTDALVAELTDRGLVVITSKDVESALGFERQKQMLGCGDESCLAEIAGAMGADRLVTGDIAQVRELTVFSAQVFNTRTGTVEKRFHERMSGGEAADLLDATERAGAELFPGTVRTGTSTRKRSVLTSTARPFALVVRGAYDVKEPGGFGLVLAEYRLSRSLRVGAGPLGTGARSFGAAVRLGWYPLVFERLALFGALEAHLLFPEELLVAANLAVGAEWAFSERFAVAVEVPLTLLASAPAEYRTTYFMPGLSASWRF